MTEDRSMMVRPDQVVCTAWIPIDLCQLGCRDRMEMAAIEKSFRRYLQAGDCQIWPPLVGHWEGPRFTVCDGRHELLALLALGRDSVFVAWLELAVRLERAGRRRNLNVDGSDSYDPD